MTKFILIVSLLVISHSVNAMCVINRTSANIGMKFVCDDDFSGLGFCGLMRTQGNGGALSPGEQVCYPNHGGTIQASAPESRGWNCSAHVDKNGVVTITDDSKTIVCASGY